MRTNVGELISTRMGSAAKEQKNTSYIVLIHSVALGYCYLISTRPTTKYEGASRCHA